MGIGCGGWTSTPEALDFFDHEHGWVAGEDCWHIDCGHALARTLDAGQTWTYSCLPVTAWARPSPISFGSATHGWLAGGPTLWRSTDGGATWAEQHTFAADVNWLQAEDAAARLGPARRQPLAHHRRRRDVAAPHRGRARQGVLPHLA